MQRKNMKSQKEIKKRLQILKSWTTSFVMTVTIVIVAIVFIPKSPEAKILNTQAFYDSVTYQVFVTDEDMSLDINTLNITLDNQFETYTYPLSLGFNVGVFDQLKPNTIYKMHIYGSKGFGLERLDEREVKTKDNPGGAIIGYQLVNQTEYDLSYQIDVLISDSNLEFSDIRLYYAYGYMDEEMLIEDYEYIEILDYRSIVELLDVPIYNTIVYLYIEAIFKGEPIILDDLRFNVPYHIETSLNLNSVSKNRIHYELYKDYNEIIDATYTIELHLGHQIIKTISNVKKTSEQDYKTDLIFEGLKKHTLYKVVVKIDYKDPQSLIRISKMIHTEEISTLNDYEITYTITAFENYFEIYIHLIDPNHYFQIPYFTIYLEGIHYPIYLDGGEFGFTPDGIGKYVTFQIPKPTEYPYYLVVGVRNQSNYTINHLIVDRIIDKP